MWTCATNLRAQILAVGYCHRIGVMNRDIKPEASGSGRQGGGTHPFSRGGLAAWLDTLLFVALCEGLTSPGPLQNTLLLRVEGKPPMVKLCDFG